MKQPLIPHNDKRAPLKNTALLMYSGRINNELSSSMIIGRIIDGQRVRGEALDEVKDFIAEKRGE